LFRNPSQAKSGEGDRKIPRRIWIAAVNSSEVREWAHVQNEINLHPGWEVSICDNAAKDKFMRDTFPGTSLLWAYENINKIAGGAAKADIWRYATLYVHGGVYIDADAALTKNLDAFIQPEDEALIGYETHIYNGDWCYSPNCKLAPLLTNKRHPTFSKTPIFLDRNIVQWCIMIAPNHIFLRKTLENFVYLMRMEFIGLSALKVARFDKFSKHVYCITGPIVFTASSREAVIEIESSANSASSGGADGDGAAVMHLQNAHPQELRTHRMVSRDFGNEGGKFKAINTHKGDSGHFTHAGDHHRFLERYAPEGETAVLVQEMMNSTEMQGSLIMGRRYRSVYYLQNGFKRPVGGMDVFEAKNWSLSDIIYFSDHVISIIPTGPNLNADGE
jgi:hypothetical protein